MASTYLSRTQGTPTNANKGTLSWWQKGATTNTTQYILACESGQERLLWYMTSGLFQGGLRGSGGSPDIDFTLVNTPRFRDPNAWYHCVLAWDSTQSTASNRLKYYVNGVQYTLSSSGTSGVNDIPQNHVMPMNKSGLPFRIGSQISGGSYFEGVMSHIHFCDGTQYQASDFGETDSTTGEWKIKTSPSVSYGNNGFWWLKDTNAATDSSPNSNTPSISGTLTKSEDCPSNVFATLDKLNYKTSALTYSNGNTTVSFPGAWVFALGNLGVSKGKWYWEAKCNSGNNANSYFGICADMVPLGQGFYNNSQNGAIMYKVGGGETYIDASYNSSGYSPSINNTDTVGLALDLDSGTKTLKIYKNGTLLSSGGTINLSSYYDDTFVYPCFSGNSSSASCSFNVNFGNGYFGTTAVSSAGTNASNLGIFEYDVPSGYTALCTKGLNE
jgi:hypothetical protein